MSDPYELNLRLFFSKPSDKPSPSSTLSLRSAAVPSHGFLGNYNGFTKPELPTLIQFFYFDRNLTFGSTICLFIKDKEREKPTSLTHVRTARGWRTKEAQKLVSEFYLIVNDEDSLIERHTLEDSGESQQKRNGGLDDEAYNKILIDYEWLSAEISSQFRMENYRSGELESPDKVIQGFLGRKMTLQPGVYTLSVAYLNGTALLIADKC